MKSNNHNPRSKSSSASISVAQLEHQLHALRVRDNQGQFALRQTLQSLNDQSHIEPGQNKSWFRNLPAMATAMAALVLVVFGVGWVVNSNSQQTNLVTTQTQPNGSIQNATNTQLEDAQDDGSLGNDDSAQISTATARLQSAVNIGNSIDESQF